MKLCQVHFRSANFLDSSKDLDTGTGKNNFVLETRYLLRKSTRVGAFTFFNWNFLARSMMSEELRIILGAEKFQTTKKRNEEC